MKAPSATQGMVEFFEVKVKIFNIVCAILLSNENG